MGSEAAATLLGHTSTAITEGHYIAPDPTTDHAPAAHLERVLGPEVTGATVLSLPTSFGEQLKIEALVGDEEVDATV